MIFIIALKSDDYVLNYEGSLVVDTHTAITQSGDNFIYMSVQYIVIRSALYWQPRSSV